MLANEARDMLRAYLSHKATWRQLHKWAVEYDWDDISVSDFEREVVGTVELMAHELSENLRSEAELTTTIVHVLASLSPRPPTISCDAHLTEQLPALCVLRYAFDSADTMLLTDVLAAPTVAAQPRVPSETRLSGTRSEVVPTERLVAPGS